MRLFLIDIMVESSGTYDSEVQRTLEMKAETPEEVYYLVSATLRPPEWTSLSHITDCGKTE